MVCIFQKLNKTEQGARCSNSSTTRWKSPSLILVWLLVIPLFFLLLLSLFHSLSLSLLFLFPSLSPSSPSSFCVWLMFFILFLGRFMAYDKHMNVVLGDAVEYRKIIPKGKTKREERDGIFFPFLSLFLHFFSFLLKITDSKHFSQTSVGFDCPSWRMYCLNLCWGPSSPSSFSFFFLLFFFFL